ncbi:hypothetical protein Gotur_000259 [Gossypium turneri]
MAPKSTSCYARIFSITLFVIFMASHGSTAATKSLLIKVDPSGKGDYRKIQDAIDAVPSNNKQVVLISVKPGIYEEKIIVPANKPFITISGSNPNDTVITWNDSGNIFESPTFSVLASDFVAQYLTIQKCHLHSLSEGDASITAQHRDSPSQNTGFTFLGCKITGVKTALLGRAWGPYSRVIFAFTYMSSVILPQGWDDWGDSSKQSSVFYREYKCYGPGASTKKRVEWAKELTIEEANPFLTKNMIGGKSWITSTTYRFTKLSSNAISRNNTRHHA